MFKKPRPIPYALRSKVETELENLERQGIIEKVIHSEWGTPVARKDGRIRLCAAYNMTINRTIAIQFQG